MGRREELARIYRSAFVRPMASFDYFVSSLKEGLTTAGSMVVAAEQDEDLIGFAYGMSFVHAQGWQRAVAPSLTSAGLQRWTDDTFELAEIEVGPAWQGRGVGSALVAQVIDRCGHPRVILATDPDPSNRAVAFYERLGFRDLLPGFRYAHGRPALILGRES